MAHRTFKLISTYEKVPDSQQVDDLFRIEIFQCVDEGADMMRCRIWAYRYYSAQLAIPKPTLVSHDIFPQEVTYLLEDEDLDFITGIKGLTEAQVLERANAAIEKWCKEGRSE